jgi:hypothetical protein
MIHGLASFFGRFHRDREIFFELRLTGEVRQPRRPQRRFKLSLAFEAIPFSRMWF